MSTTDTTNTVTGTGQTTATASQVNRTDTAGSLGQDAFLKLLVAQMQNQDPTSPQDSGQMMAQLASFSQVSQLQSVVSSQQAMALQQDFTGAVSLIGKSVTYTDAKGNSQTGTVSSVKTDPSGSLLQIGNDSVHTGAILSVQ
jgi:flagellar basal-body rod modification protein FlgD